MFRYSSSSLLIMALFCLPACISTKSNLASKLHGAVEVHNLIESTFIIRCLIKHDAISTILEDADQSQIDLLLNNFSPAEIAFESEVLSLLCPVIVYFFKADSPEYENLKTEITQLAQQYNEQIKWVAIDADQLYSLAQKAEIIELPTVIVINNRLEIERLEGSDALDVQRLKPCIDELLSTEKQS